MLEIFLLCLTLALFWYLQWRTGFFSTRYFVQVGLLLLIVILAVALIVVSWPPSDLGRALVLVGALSVAVYHALLFLFKTLLDTDNKYRWMHKANRALVNYDVPHQRFTLRTQDDVRIEGVSLHNTPEKTKKAVIVCHGAGRSKNTMSIVQTCTILATRYDVFTFDFRGHMESGGFFRANGDTQHDLTAVIDHVKRAGYEKIAVVGWSVGATTALLSAANGCPIDAIIAGSPPPVSLGEYKHLRLLKRVPMFQVPGGSAAATARYMRVVPGKPYMNVLDFVDQIPPIPILLAYNDYDTTLNVEAAAFEVLHRRLPSTTEAMRLPGSGHLFDWPNTFFFWEKMLAWLAIHF